MVKVNALKGIMAYVSLVMGTICSFCFGEIDVFLTTLVTLLIIDYITGLTAAYMNNELNSKIGFKGIIKKVLRLIIVAAAVQVDRVTNANGFVRNTVIIFFIANEGLSILENAGKCGVPIPKKFLEVLEQLQDDSSEEEDNDYESY